MYPFPGCTSIAVSGATCSGKIFSLYRLLCHKNEMFENPPQKVLYCYGIYQLFYEKMEKELPFITFQQGLPSTSDLEALAEPDLSGRSYGICDHIFRDGKFICERHASSSL